MNRRDIQKVIDKVPGLTDYGFGIFQDGQGMTFCDRKIKIREEQAALLGKADECTKICEWLADVDKIWGINTSRSSRDLKQIFEDDTGVQVSNGAFIAAAVHCGFPYETEYGVSDVFFGMSRLSIRKKEKDAQLSLSIRNLCAAKDSQDRKLDKCRKAWVEKMNPVPGTGIS